MHNETIDQDGVVIPEEVEAVVRYDERGREIGDPRPVAMPLGYEHPESIAEMIQRMIRINLSQAAADSEAETFDEANDFDMDDEDEPYSEYEERPMIYEGPDDADDKRGDPAGTAEPVGDGTAAASPSGDTPASVEPQQQPGTLSASPTGSHTGAATSPADASRGRKAKGKSAGV